MAVLLPFANVGAYRCSPNAFAWGSSFIASERIGSWRDALLAEIGRGRCVSSRGRYNPRGVKRKMSNFKVRRRGAELHRRHEPTPVLRVLRI